MIDDACSNQGSIIDYTPLTMITFHHPTGKRSSLKN